jgi:tetratricopeptide (TPR) repeat protein
MGYESLEPGVQTAIRSAIEQVQSSTQSDSAAEAWLQLAMTYHGNGLLQEADTCYQVTTSLDPDRGQAWYGHGLALEELGQPQQAIVAFNQAHAAAPKYAPAAWNTGYVLLELDQLEDARSAFETALNIDGDSPAARVGLARVALSSDQPELAASILESLRLDISNTYLDLLLAKAYRQQGRIEDAAALLAGGVQNPPRFNDPWADDVENHGASYEACVARVDRLMGNGAMRDALTLARESLETYPDDIPLLNRVSVAQSNLGQRDQALRTLKRVLRLDETSAATHLNLSMQYQAADDLTRARRHAQQCVQLNPTLPEGHLQMGRIHMLNSNIPQAAQSYARAFELGVQDIDERLVLANLLTRIRQFDASLRQYQNVLKQQPANGQALAGVVDVFLVSGNLEQAGQAAQVAMARAPDHPTVQQVVKSLQSRIRQQGNTTP